MISLEILLIECDYASRPMDEILAELSVFPNGFGSFADAPKYYAKLLDYVSENYGRYCNQN